MWTGIIVTDLVCLKWLNFLIKKNKQKKKKKKKQQQQKKKTKKSVCIHL